MQYELGIIGAGNMAEAIVRGVIAAKLISPDQIIASDVSSQRRELFSGELKVKAVEDNRAVGRQSKVMLLSVKPQMMATALARLGEVTDPNTLIISIAAGISSAFIEKHLSNKVGAREDVSVGFASRIVPVDGPEMVRTADPTRITPEIQGGGKSWRIIRSMPNTPMLVGEGMVAIAAGRHASADDLKVARTTFESAAAVVEVTEDKIDAVTAVSGSGPAYFFYLVEQMIKAGVELGLTPEQSHLLATRTALGAAKMLTTSPDAPQELRRKVTSPGGTTQAAITCFESHGVGQAIVEGIKAAENRGKELGQ